MIVSAESMPPMPRLLTSSGAASTPMLRAWCRRAFIVAF